MVDWLEVVEVADALLAEGKLVSVRAVRSALKAHGSFRDVGPLVTRWKSRLEDRPATRSDDVPQALQKQHGAVLTALWAEARVMAALEHRDERERWKADLQATNEVRDEALQETDRLLEDVSTLRAEVERLRGLLGEREARLDRVRSEEFWDRLMKEVFEILPAAGGMAVEDILPRLRETVHREAANHKERVTAAILRKKMQTRVTHGRYFELLSGDLFSRRPPTARQR